MAKAKKIKKTLMEKYRVIKDRQWRDFDCQEDARQHLIICLEKGAITFCSIERVEVPEK